MDERGWGWTASEIRHAQLIEWIVQQSAERPEGQGIKVKPFYNALPDQSVNTNEIARGDLDYLEGQSLIRQMSGLGGIDALDVLITQHGRGFAEQLQAARASRYRRKGAAHDAMVDWLYSRDALSPPGLPWAKMLEDATKSYWFAQPFTHGDLDDAAAWLHARGIVDGATVEEAKGPVVLWLTDTGAACAEDFHSDTAAYLAGLQRRAPSATDGIGIYPAIPDPRAVSSTGTAVSEVTTFAVNRKAVMVIYGHDTPAKDAMFDWLRAIGLQPREWNQLVTATGAASPYIGQVLDRAFQQAQAVIALFTPDERVLSAAASPHGPDAWRLQARPNVIFEAGMALVTHPDRTVLVLLGAQELPSDLAGRHYIRLSPTDPAPLQDLATRLQRAGCKTDLSGTDWLRLGRFPDRDHFRPASTVGADGTTSPVPAPAGSHRAAPAIPGDRATAHLSARLTRTLTGHNEGVYGVAFSPDGTLLATASVDKTARLWDLATGKPARTLTGHDGPLWGVAFSPDGTLLATASSDQTARLWDLATGQLSRTLAGHTQVVRGAAFSPEGVPVHTVGGHTAVVRGVAFSPDGTLLATASSDHTARLWDLATGKPSRTLGSHTEGVHGVAFSPDGTLLATASGDKTARLWDLATGKPARSLTGHGASVYGVAFSPDGALLATASGDTARLWDLATGKPTRTLTGHEASVFGVAFSPDGGLLATASNDHTARLWDLATGQCMRILIGHSEPVLGVAFSPDGGLLATASSDHTVRLWTLT